MFNFILELIMDESGNEHVNVATGAAIAGGIGYFVYQGATALAPVAGTNISTGMGAAQNSVTYGDTGTYQNGSADGGEVNGEDWTVAPDLARP